MSSRVTSFSLSDATYRKINLAAAAKGQCSSEFIRDALAVGLDAAAKQDPILGTAFRMYDDQAAELAQA